MGQLTFQFQADDDRGFRFHEIVPGHGVLVGRLPPALTPDDAAFDRLWEMKPSEYPLIRIHGRLTPTPRWSQAFGHDYLYSGETQRAAPTPPALARLLAWAQHEFDGRLTGATVNWYDARRGHYIGPHRDSRESLVVDAPIVNIALGEERPFRMRPWKGKGFRDFAAPHGTVIVIPYRTNLVATHEVPLAARHGGRRISVTLRAFVGSRP